MLHKMGKSASMRTKFRTVSTSAGLMVHAHRPMTGSRNFWAPYFESSIDEQLYTVFLFEGLHYYLLRDSGFIRRPYFDTPFSGSQGT